MDPRILIIDDDDATNMLMEVLLTEQGYQVNTARNGREALDCIHKAKPDLIITDIVMPHVDGFQLLKELKGREETAGIPMMVISVRHRMADTFHAFGVEDFIFKPFETVDFLTKVHKRFNRTVSFPQTPEPKKEPEKPESTAFDVAIISAAEQTGDNISEHFLRTGQKALVLKTGRDILSRIPNDPVRLIIVDVELPDINCAELIKAVRRDKSARQVPILLFSHPEYGKKEEASSHQRRLQLENAKTSCLNAGATKYIGEYATPPFLSALAEYARTPAAASG